MLLTITTNHAPATDIGFLLEKHPDKVHDFELSAGRATVFYPEATEKQCTVALLLEVDAIGLVRSGAARQGDPGLDQYVNDRPYVASSFLSVAIGLAFKSALAGKSRNRPELAATAIPLEAHIPALPCRGGEGALQALFAPLGYTVETTRHPLDEHFPEWGMSPYYSLVLRGVVRLQDLLKHLYVLIPALDDRKHYWVGEAEVEKLLRHASEWLGAHPMKEWIARRYLKHRRSLARMALERLTIEDSGDEGDEPEMEAQEGASHGGKREIELENRVFLQECRMERVTALVTSLGAKSVVDLGCGEGQLLERLLKLSPLERVVGMDVSVRSLERAADRLHLERMPPRQRARIALLHGSLVYRDDRLKGFGAATLIEVIEHLDPPRLAALERVLFEAARPTYVIVTTPNREYNVNFPGLAHGTFRHSDHRFEWTRDEFRAWCGRQTDRFGYAVEYFPIGDEDPLTGPPTQLALFSLTTSH
jgi:3' terminal RNA ribose 2'-O-methyltransferase Hen1